MGRTEIILAVAQQPLSLGKRVQLVGDDGFKCRCEENEIVVVRVSKIIACRNRLFQEFGRVESLVERQKNPCKRSTF